MPVKPDTWNELHRFAIIVVKVRVTLKAEEYFTRTYKMLQNIRHYANNYERKYYLLNI
jgi:hypothetical protein